MTQGKGVISNPVSGMYVVRNLYFDPKTKCLIVEYELPRGGGDVAIQQMLLDPNAQAYTDDEIVGKVNAATANITRAGSVDAAARPLVADEVTDTELASGAAKDNLDALADTARGYVKTDPAAGQFPVIAVQIADDGKAEIDYDDVAV